MNKKRLAIIGGGSSGLVCLKFALELVPHWDIVCFEKTNRVTGCWGSPPQGFVSTSTKFTTQFACFVKFDASVQPSDSSASVRDCYPEFFVDDDYGRYLTDFAEHFDLKKNIRLNSTVTRVSLMPDKRWEVSIETGGATVAEVFDALVFCTGLVDQPRLPDCQAPILQEIARTNDVRKKCIVVIGGGESAVDMAQRLAKPELENRVYLSVRGGIRVSPRYHPIRGVPSDFLRNRLLLSFHPVLRNRVGEWFVRFRIRFEGLLQKMFAHKSRHNLQESTVESRARRELAFKLTQRSKDSLFNVYHNKSDDFLRSVAAGQIKVVGAPTSSKHDDYDSFDRESETIRVDPDLVVPAIGYSSDLEKVSSGAIGLADFYLGCCHAQHENVFAVGYTRPIIGNIPSISEMQARFVCSLLSKSIPRPLDITQLHPADRKRLSRQFPKLDISNVYPVEMFPYCDRLAKLMNCFPSFRRVGSFRKWVNIQLSPATTIHYTPQFLDDPTVGHQPIHTPTLLTALLIILKPLDWLIRILSKP